MNIYRCLFTALVMSFIAAYPLKAYSDTLIPFYASYTGQGNELTVICDGPWVRYGDHNISAGTENLLFYSAKVTKFSPYGEWNCSAQAANGEEGYKCYNGCTVHVCLQKGDDAVYLTMNLDSITSNLPEKCDSSTTQASLGDDNSKDDPDRDTFGVQGTEGDAATVTLEEDPASGHSGEQATLILRSGNSTLESKTGALPVEISATLPATGEYELVVQQHGIPKDVRFSGDYYLSVKYASGEAEDIKPTDNVEQ